MWLSSCDTLTTSLLCTALNASSSWLLYAFINGFQTCSLISFCKFPVCEKAGFANNRIKQIHEIVFISFFLKVKYRCHLNAWYSTSRMPACHICHSAFVP